MRMYINMIFSHHKCQLLSDNRMNEIVVTTVLLKFVPLSQRVNSVVNQHIFCSSSDRILIT